MCGPGAQLTGMLLVVFAHRDLRSRCPADDQWPGTGRSRSCVVDEAAAAQLANAEFYRYAVKYKPPQQKC